MRALAVVFLLAGLLVSCAPALSPSEPPTEDELREAYERAIVDASQMGHGDIYKDLVAIVPHDDRVIWRGEPGNSEVLVATWTDASFARFDEYGERTSPEYVWVTIAPELQNFCSDLASNERSRRMAQILGLPPEPGYDRVVQLWVDPKALFRPCPDPEITDSQCEVDFPRPKSLVAIDSSHVAWMQETTNLFHQEGGYPWTALGYTYDWGNPDSNIGLSEFVIQPKASLYVDEVATTQAYCQ